MSTTARNITVLLPLLLLSVYGIWSHHPPAALPETAPADQFSAGRAIRHVEAACVRPHPTGSAESDRVRQYLMDTLTAMGVRPEVQDTTVVRSLPGVAEKIGNSVANIRNVIVRLPGTAPSKALLYMAHYDSTAWGPGAADDWAGCSTLLETMRALRAGKPLANDVIFLFTDAEEGGLKGSYAFTKHHPWIRDIGLVVNFDVRGTSGPAYMYETGPDNGPLISHFVKAATHPAANSFMSEIYYRMGVNSDYNVQRKIGLPGLNSAFIRNIAYYHTENDSPAHLDRGSLQHFGYNAMDFARYFGNIRLENLRGPEAIYFNAAGYWMAHYPASSAPLFAALALGLLGIAARLGVARGRLAGWGILRGCLGFLGCLAGAAAGAGAVSFVVWRSLGYYTVYQNNLFLVAALGVGIAAFLWLFLLFRRWVEWEEMAFGALCAWAALLVYTTFWFRGGSFGFLWPLLFCTLGLTGHFAWGDRRMGSVKQALGFAVSSAPALSIGVPIVYSLNDALTAVFSPAAVVWTALLAGLLIPQLAMLTESRRFIIPVVAGLAGVAVCAAGLLSHQFSAATPQVGSLSYGLNTDTGQAYWLSRATELNGWERRFFPHPRRATVTEFLPNDRQTYWKAEAPAAGLAPAEWTIVGDTPRGERRELTLRLTSPRAAPRLDIFLNPEIEVFRSEVNGRRYGSGKRWSLSYDGLGARPADLVIEIPASAKPVLTVVECSYGLPEVPGSGAVTMPPDMIFEPNTLGWGKGLRSRWTLVRQSFKVPAAGARP